MNINRKLKRILGVALLCSPLTLVSVSAESITTVLRPNTSDASACYISNKAPLLSSFFIKLPTGSIKPQGWILTQLNLQAEGLCGHLGEISAWLQKTDNAWLSSGGKWGWEEVPYWLRGYSSMAWILNRKEMQKESKLWIDAILKNQKPDGDFGPREEGLDHFWANMVVLWLLQDYYEYTGDKRVTDFMTKYFHYQLTVPDNEFLRKYWENSRGGDNLWSVLWLYNRTGDGELLKLADKLHRCTADWTQAQNLPNWHNVNIAQGVREPAEYFMFKKDSSLLRATYNDQQLIRRIFGQMPGGMFAADENARMGYIDPRQGTETCGFAEQMATDEILMLTTGDPYWAENCEDVAFNSFPAAFSEDYKALRYLTCANMVVSDEKDHSPGVQNAGPFLAMNPFSSRCCQHNHGFGLPYYAQHLVLATNDNGLATVLFGSCQTTALVGKETQKIVLTEETDYPFDSKVKLTISAQKQVTFPLYIRIPSWTHGAKAAVNGKPLECRIESGKYLRIEREWKNGDLVELEFPMDISLRRWATNQNSVSVDYGPLTLSLRINEKYEKKGSDKTAIGDSKWQKGADTSKWPTWLIHPASDWNFALCTDEPIKLVKKEKVKENENPFVATKVPLVFSAKGRKVPGWGIDKYGLCAPLPDENAVQTNEKYDLELIPMGAARLRISSFPQAK